MNTKTLSLVSSVAICVGLIVATSCLSSLGNTTPSYLVWGSAEEEGWLSELNIIAGSIKNPAIREAALKQMLALAQMDAQLK